MGRHVAVAALLIELLEVGLHRGNVADDAVGRQIGKHLLEGWDGELHRHGIDDEFWGERLHLVERGEALAVIGEAHAFRVFLIDGRLVVETEQVEKETPHLSCAHD